MSLTRIASRFYTDCWALRPDIHHQFGAVLQSHLRGTGRELAFSEESYRRAIDDDECKLRVEQGIAVVPIVGVIGKRLSRMEMSCADGYDLTHLDRTVLQLMRMPEVHTVVLDINSPGGVASGVMESATLLRELAETKRLIAYANTDACSAAYWLAAAADELYAQPTGTVGSISAYIAILDESRAFEMEGLTMEVFRDGALKGIGIPGKAITDEERAFLQSRVEESGGRFKAFVASRRPALADGAMQGQWFSGEAAFEAGLVDGLHLTLDHLLASLLV